MEYLLSKTNSAFDAFFAPSAMYENMLYTIDHTLIVFRKDFIQLFAETNIYTRIYNQIFLKSQLVS